MQGRKPFSWQPQEGPGRPPPGPSTDPGDHNRAALLRLGLAFAVAVFLASSAPLPLVPVMAGSLLLVAAVASAVLALFLGERPAGPRLTRWDEAAVLMAASLVMDLLTDPAAATAALQALSAGAP
ncbi:MAG: hypothetical protein H6907_22255 [Hyphomicrobiales bacterium]|nr:hypothetical protein [Hyphomicrobiales bacterium]